MNRLYPSQFPFLVQYVCTLQYLLSVGAEHALYSKKINVIVRTSSRKADNIVSNIVITLYKITVHLHCPHHVTPKCMTNTRLYKQLNLCCISPWITLTSSALLKRLSCRSRIYSDFTRRLQQTGPFSDFLPVNPMASL